MVVKSKKIVSLLLAFILAFGNMPALHAADAVPEVWVNLLQADMDTHFDGGINPFTMDKTDTGGSQKIVQINGNNAVEFRDSSSPGGNLGSYFYFQLTKGKLISRINEIYSMPVGTEPVEFVLEYKLLRSVASDKPVPNNINAELQFGPYDDAFFVPRFPLGSPTPSITGTAAYKNTEPNAFKTVNDSDIPGYRFKIKPNGGKKLITSFKIAFGVRVNTDGTDEAIVVDDLAVYEVTHDGGADTEPPTAPTGLTAAAIKDTSVNLSWTASTDNVGVTGYDIYQNGQLVGKVGGDVTSYTANGMTPNTTYIYTVKARDVMGNISAPSNVLSVTTNPSTSGLPEPFGNQDIGAVKLAGSASYDEGTDTFIVTASGKDIFDNADEFHYVYRPWTGDGQIIAHVTSMENSVAWTKAGVMIRGNMTSGSPHVMTAVSPGNGVFYGDRLVSGGASTVTKGSTAAAPYWVKMTREGNLITSYDSEDGINWNLIKQQNVNLPETVYFGLALTSHSVNLLSKAKFENVSIGDLPPAESNYSPYPGTIETRRDWLWNKVKTMSTKGSLPMNIVQYVAQIIDGQRVSENLKKLDDMFKAHDWEEYKTVSKMYAYLLVGDKFDDAMKQHVKDYFAGYKYAKLNQTENLRISNYVSGYLVGQYLPDVVDLAEPYPRTFPYNEGNGNSGATLKSINRANIEEMIDKGVKYGWAEYESPEYTFMTYMCLNAVYQYTDEPDFKQKVKMAMDVMWFEWANDWIDGTFISTSNRAKGDSVSASDLTWRAADHTALSWMYFGGHRAQQGIGESDLMVPSAIRPYLEYMGMVYAPGMTYTPPEMAIQIGRKADKDYLSRKTNLMNSSGNNLKTYRTTYVKPNWGMGTEVTYNRVDNWIEDIPVVVRWHSDLPNPLFRMSVDQGTSTIGNYDQPENHRIMQDGKAAVGVYQSLSGPNATDNYLNAMFPDTGSIKTKDEQGGWVFSDTGPMYFAYKMIKPYSWYHQTPFEVANKVKTTGSQHPTASLSYSYNILRSQADKNGWVLETADASEYADFASFKNAVLTRTTVDSSHIDEAIPRLIYKNLDGHVMDITFDRAKDPYNNTHKIDGVAIDYNAYKLFDTPWLQQEKNSNIFTASYGSEILTYDFANWTITNTDPNVIVDVTGVSLNASALTVGAGKTADLKAILEPGNATNRAVTWKSQNTNVATVSANGKVTAIAPGKTVITATTEEGSFTAECTVTVVIEPLLADSFENGLINWESYSNLVWQIQGSGTNAQLKGSTTLTGPQRIMVKASLLPYTVGNYSIAFTATTDSFRTMFRYVDGTNYYFLEFKNKNFVAMWKYANSGTPVQVGTTVDINAVIPGFDLAESHRYNIEVNGEVFKLSIDETLITTFNDSSLQAGGVGFALKSVGPAVNLLVDEVLIKPIVADAVKVDVTGVTLNPSTVSLTAGGSATLLATVTPAEATNKAVTWGTSNSSIVTVDSSGKVTAVGAGTAVITVTTTDGDHTASSEVTVTAAEVSVPVTGVSLNPSTVSLTAGGSATLLATVTPAEATNKAVTWGTSNSSIASVDSSGKVTAVGAGTAVITVTTTDGDHTASSEVTVTAAEVSVPVTGISMDQETLSLKTGDTATLQATISPVDATNKAVTWSTSNPLFATVDNNGKVTAVGAGNVVITVTTVDGGYTASCNVTVTDTPPTTTGTGNDQPVTPSASGIITVPANSLKNGSNGRSTVEVPANTTEVKIPANAASLLAENNLEVKTDKLALEIPSALFKQLAGQISAEELQGSTISLKLEPLKSSESQALLAKGQQLANAAIKHGSDVYELSLTLTTASGGTKKLTKFDQPITIRLKIDSSMNPKLTGIYYLSDEGQLEWIGGKYVDGEMIAEIQHFSKYAVFEVKKDFADLATNHWAYNVIQELADKQIIQGTSAAKFEPGRSITRAEFTAMLVNALKLTKSGENSFADVPADKWYAQAVSIAYEAGIVTGTGATTFDPNGLITREQMVTMTMKAYRSINGNMTADASATFTDASQFSAWATPYVKEAAALELIRGRAEGLFVPKGLSTRAEAAQVIYGLLNLQ
ncbi:Ig-like domain-containing protein [Cohnella endophytica]|nr:Ig-like domain-containing protein [Cohnella endophytica]